MCSKHIIVFDKCSFIQTYYREIIILRKKEFEYI